MKQFALILLALFAFGSYAQPVYQMSNMVVYDCEGILTDSDAGNPTGNYTHNENYSFTICPPNAVSITITFTSFETELNNDYVRIFDGADTNAPLIGGPFSGANLPPIVVSNASAVAPSKTRLPELPINISPLTVPPVLLSFSVSTSCNTSCKFVELRPP